MGLAKKRYNTQRWSAKDRNIEFKFTLEQWYDWWLSHGVDKETAPAEYCHSDRLEMCRYNDQGAYEPSNVYCATHKQNMKDRDATKFASKFHKRIRTEYGIFESRIQAARSIGVTPQTITNRLKNNPKEYYYV
jgi:hypothetical protein